jgi:hypothetical protein
MIGSHTRSQQGPIKFAPIPKIRGAIIEKAQGAGIGGRRAIFRLHPIALEEGGKILGFRKIGEGVPYGHGLLRPIGIARQSLAATRSNEEKAMPVLWDAIFSGIQDAIGLEDFIS